MLPVVYLDSKKCAYCSCVKLSYLVHSTKSCVSKERLIMFIMRRRVSLMRKKGGSSAWTPGSVRGGSAPPQGVSGQEALLMTYRPLPPTQTVEHEEDFGSSMIIQLEFVSRRALKCFDTTALAFSETELSRGRSRLADILNRERRLSAEASNSVPFETVIDENTREVRTARYLFDEARMSFCERFEQAVRGKLFPAQIDVDNAANPHPLFSLMEACAIIHGCDDPSAVEGYMSKFLSLDKDTIEEEEEQLRAIAATSRKGDHSLRLSDEVGEEKEEDESADVADEGSTAEAALSLPAEFAEFAPIYQSYAAHCKGEAPIASTDLRSAKPPGVTLERRRWRDLMLRLSREEYATLSELDVIDAKNLNDQLHALKFMDLKVGDVVREIAQRRKFHDPVAPGNMHVGPRDASSSHPELRQKKT